MNRSGFRAGAKTRGTSTVAQRVVIPSRVTKEELHSGISGAKIFTMSSIASLRNDLKAIRDATATKVDFEQLKEEVSKSRRV